MRVTDIYQNGSTRVHGVQALDAHGARRTLRARYVVGADGLRSVIARRLGLVKTSRFWPRRIALVAHYQNVQGVGDMGEMHVDYDGYFGVVDRSEEHTSELQSLAYLVCRLLLAKK